MDHSKCYIREIVGNSFGCDSTLVCFFFVIVKYMLWSLLLTENIIIIIIIIIVVIIISTQYLKYFQDLMSFYFMI